MNEVDLRKKIEEFGKGSFDKGVQQIYSAFVGARRFLGIDKRFRTLCDSVETLLGEGLVSNIPEGIDLMNYLITQPTRYETASQEVKVLVKEDSKNCFSGYTFSRVVKDKEVHYF